MKKGDDDVRMLPVTSSVEKMFGLLRRDGAPSRSLEEIDERIAALVRDEDERVQREKSEA